MPIGAFWGRRRLLRLFLPIAGARVPSVKTFQTNCSDASAVAEPTPEHVAQSVEQRVSPAKDSRQATPAADLRRDSVERQAIERAEDEGMPLAEDGRRAYRNLSETG